MSVQTTQFEQDRCEAELNDALIGVEEIWYRQKGDTFIAAGRCDGKATVVAAERGWTPPPAADPESGDHAVAAGDAECCWQVLHIADDELVTATHASAVEAVRAANELADAVTT